MGTMQGQAAMAEMEPESKSFLSRLVGVFISPGETFEDIARRPDFWAPLILAIILAIAISESMIAKIGAEQLVRLSIAQSGRAATMTPEQVEQAVSQGAKFMHLTTVAIPAGVALALLIIAGVGLLIANSVFGAQLNYKTAFSVACYANLIGVLGFVLGLVMILGADPETFNAKNFVPANVGFFLNPLDTSKVLYSLATSIDLFTFWMIAVLGIGFSEATGRKVKAMPMGLSLLAVWVIWVLIKMGAAAI